ncbi:MAG: DegV family EDD domain-containing protein [Clostridia bacterium]|nr:DegV family EDD domain-containing protein [Clostridia bacterium]
MSKFVIIPDITCDLSEELRTHFGLEDYVTGYVHIDDESIVTTLDWSNISRENFYKTLSDKRRTVTSAVASPEEFYRVFKKYAEQGYDIISMSLSSKISSTFSVATSACERVSAEFGVKTHSVDTLRMSGSFGLLVAYALELRRGGADFDSVVAWLEENKHKVHQMGPIDDLTFIARRGRISKGKAIMGNLAGVKPMGDSNTDGYVTVLAKAKGIKRALDATVEYTKRMMSDPKENYIFVMHSDRESYALELRDKLESSIDCRGVFVSDVFSGCGTNIGPGMISVYFLGEPVSEDNAREKEVLTAILAEL